MLPTTIRTGVYVDAANIAQNGGYKLNYGSLREFACRDRASGIRLNVYLAYDGDRAERDREYRQKQRDYHEGLREQGFRVASKLVKWFCDEETGSRVAKANADLDMAVEALLQAQQDRLDRIVLVTGDGDFVQVVKALQRYGCRVEVVGFDNVSEELRREADLFFSGFLIPGLLPPISPANPAPSGGYKRWGEVGSRVRGSCYHFNPDKGFGFMRFLRTVESGNLWNVDPRQPGSPFEAVWFHVSELPTMIDPADLPHRSLIFEFDLVSPTSQTMTTEKENQKLQAANIRLIRSAG